MKPLDFRPATPPPPDSPSREQPPSDVESPGFTPLAPLGSPGAWPGSPGAPPGFGPVPATSGDAAGTVPPHAADAGRADPRPALSGPRLTAALAGATALWFALYFQLPGLARLAAYDLFGLDPATRLGQAVEFFLYDAPKVLMLLGLVVFWAGVARSFFTPERTRRALAGRSPLAGNVLAALLGVVTPFCTCSAVSLFIGFVTSGVPLGATFSFLVSAPMVNEIALVLLFGLVGWKVALLYAVTGLTIAVASGWIIGRLGMERHVQDWVRLAVAEREAAAAAPDFAARVRLGLSSMQDILAKVWPYVLAGIAVGAGIHGWAPEGWLTGIMGREAWWSVPAAVLVGVPLYSNAAGVVPLVEAMLAKGAALGTVLAFMMSVIGLSLPEILILRKVLKTRLIAVFVAVVATGILIVGYLFNLIL